MSFSIQLKPSDSDRLFEVQSDEIMHSSTLRIIVEDFEDDLKLKNAVIPVNVEEFYLEKIVKWLKEHKNDSMDNKFDRDLPFSLWDQQFFQMEPIEIGQLIMPAYQMGISYLSEQAVYSCAMLIKGKTPEEIRQIFGIENDLTPDEEQNMRRENMWIAMD